MRHFLLALQFLTILPVKVKGEVLEGEVARSSAFFVLTGLLQGIFLIILLKIGGTIFYPELTISLIVLALAISNGGLHLDGLADTFDALAIKSTGDPVRDKEKRLLVMKDSTTGAIGGTSLIFAIMLKIFSLKNISLLGTPVYYASVVIMPVISKWAMTVALLHGRPARDNGLGKLFIEGMTIKEFLISTFTLLAIYGLLPVVFRNLSIEWLIFNISVTALLYGITGLWIYLCNRMFGGSTGDTLGALSEITEIAFLFMVIIWSRLFIS